jgi:hypothetical protein
MHAKLEAKKRFLNFIKKEGTTENQPFLYVI